MAITDPKTRGWRFLREAALPFVADVDFAGAQTLPADAILSGVSTRRVENDVSVTTGLLVVVQAFDATTGAPVASAGTLSIQLIELVQTRPADDTRPKATFVTARAAVASVVLSTVALLPSVPGTDRYTVRLFSGAGLPATGNLRVYVRDI